MKLDSLYKHNLKMALPVLLVRTPIMLIVLAFYYLGQAADEVYYMLDGALPTFKDRHEWREPK